MRGEGRRWHAFSKTGPGFQEDCLKNGGLDRCDLASLPGGTDLVASFCFFGCPSFSSLTSDKLLRFDGGPSAGKGQLSRSVRAGCRTPPKQTHSTCHVGLLDSVILGSPVFLCAHNV